MNQTRTQRTAVMIYWAAMLILPLGLLMTLSGFCVVRTYVIIDEDRHVELTTFSRDPVQVLREAGISLKASDTWLQKDNRIEVQRGDTVHLCLRGQWMEAAIEGETVAQLLTRLGITLEEGDVLSHGEREMVYDGMELRIDRYVTRQETYTSTVAYDTIHCADDSIPAGTQAVLTRGRDGEVFCTANVTYRNGQEVEREILTEEMIRHPVTEVLAQGRGESPQQRQRQTELVIGDNFIQLPTGELLTYTGTDTVRATAYTHTDPGCDMITATGTTVHRGTVAVDPRFIPYGTRMFIVSNDGEYVYGMAVAEDCGGAIKRDRMDLYFPTYEECIEFGFRSCTIYYLG